MRPTFIPPTLCLCAYLALRRYLDDVDDVNAAEFTPRDLYQMGIFDVSGAGKFDWCQGHDDLPYCQFLGHWLQDMPGVGTIDPYPHMNERCYMYEHYPDGC